jgi:PhoPQ-activated pathogenicity-related protein
VRLWQATNPEARDFRLYVTGPIWTSTPSDLSVKFEPPEKGFRAYLMELSFADGFVCTTDVFILAPGTPPSDAAAAPDVSPLAAGNPEPSAESSRASL